VKPERLTAAFFGSPFAVYRSPRLRSRFTVYCSLLFTGCSGIQSTFDARSQHAQIIAEIGWVLFASAVVIFILVTAFTVYALIAKRRSWIANRNFVVAAGAVFPVVALSALLIYSFIAARDITADSGRAALKIEVVGEQWWWRVRYPDHGVVTANEIRIPLGEPVEFVLTTADVIHSFWVPNLAGKLDMIPGHVNRLRVEADHEGVFRGQCAEYCGGPHAKMAFYVFAQPKEEFERWLANERAIARQPDNAFLALGQKLFLENACATCHAIRGTRATGQLGPDLTHVGSRSSIGAGILPNNVGTLAGWIASSQHLKPENRMPSFNTFSGEELRALAAYLASLQ
jgi:cytochrome c oxidase subunit 2